MDPAQLCPRPGELVLMRIVRTIGEEAMGRLGAAGWNPDYVSVRRQSDLACAQAADADLVFLAAAKLGATRLVDNLEVRAPL